MRQRMYFSMAWTFLFSVASVLGTMACIGCQTTTSRAPPTVQTLLPGSWQTTLVNGASETLVFEQSGRDQPGWMSRTVSADGEVVDSWTGSYRFHDNPLLGDQDRTQIVMTHIDPNWGEQEETLILRSISNTSMQLTGLYDARIIQYQRVD